MAEHYLFTILNDQGNWEWENEFIVLFLNHSRPELTYNVKIFTFVCKESEEPAGGIQLRRDTSMWKNIADFRIMVFKEKSQLTKAALEADEIVIQE